MVESIHVSQETADLVVASGKSAWICERKDRIVAEGKGELVTFWMTPSIMTVIQEHMPKYFDT